MTTPEQLALLRLRVTDNAEGDVHFGRDEMADVLDEIFRLQSLVIRQSAQIDQFMARISHALMELEKED
jgi:hypothetical protein